MNEQTFFERFISKKAPLAHLPKKKNVQPGMYRCCYCEKPLTFKNYTKEHLIPISKWGNNSVYNVKPCCAKCNGAKDSMDVQQFVNKLSFGTLDDYTLRMIRNAKAVFLGVDDLL